MSSSPRFLVSGLMALTWLGAVQGAAAATASDTFEVTASVAAACQVDADDLGFGAYEPLSGAPKDSTTTVTVTCTNGTDYTIGMSEGLGAGASIASRRMTSGTDQLTYTLYRNAGYSQLWGDTIDVDTLADTGTGAAQPHTVYGRIDQSQAAPAGNYSDTITVTVTF